MLAGHPVGVTVSKSSMSAKNTAVPISITINTIFIIFLLGILRIAPYMISIFFGLFGNSRRIGSVLDKRSCIFNDLQNDCPDFPTISPQDPKEPILGFIRQLPKSRTYSR